MRDRKHLYGQLFFGAAMFAAVFVLAEIVLKSYGKSICVYEGCRMTAQYARFGDLSIFLLGLGVFSSLAGLAFANRSLRRPQVERFINLILVVALACEGFFVGYLAFQAGTICLFCIIIFAFMVFLGIIRVLAGEKDVLAGFAALAAVFALQFLILPAGAQFSLSSGDRFVLFYSKDCKHCTEVLKELEDKKISVKHLEVAAYSAYLKSMGIDSVPTLFVNDAYQKIFLTGKDAILQYLISCDQPVDTATKKAGKRKDPEPWLFPQPTILSWPASSADAGICKQDEICK